MSSNHLKVYGNYDTSMSSPALLGSWSLCRLCWNSPQMSTRDRWPARVYAEGEEPDYRFSLANERTFLAWLRTALALIAAGVVVEVIELGVSEAITRGLSMLLLGLGVLSPILAWLRWSGGERAIRLHEPLPSLGVGAAVAAGTLLLAGVVLAVGVVLL